MSKVYIALGSNLGDRENNIWQALLFLSREVRIIKCSSLYETEPVGYTNQPWFLNSVAQIETNLLPPKLLHLLLSIELRLGRSRIIPQGPRIIDLDLLDYKRRTLQTPELTLPHPHLHLRKFVLIPLAEIAPIWKHPILNKSVTKLVEEVKDNAAVSLYRKNTS